VQSISTDKQLNHHTIVDRSCSQKEKEQVNDTANKSKEKTFVIDDNILLFFNEHDTRVALGWENYKRNKADPKATTGTTHA